MKKYIKENKNRIIILIFSFLFQTFIYGITKLFQGTPMHLNNYFDNMIPFIPAFVIFYVLWYLLLFLIPLLILKYNKKVFDRYIVTCLIYALFEGIIFILLPTTMTREPLVVDSISTWIINIIYKVDTPVNLFPSAHCALAILFIISTLDVKEIKKEYKILITITSVLIMLSTVFIKQHVIVDVLGAFIIVPMYYIIRRKKINLEESGIYAKIFCQKKRTK